MLLHPSSRVRSRRPAFTLVEMLVVLGIIGILIALILPAIMGAQYRARVAAINMEIKQLESALDTYKQQKGEYPPSFGEDYSGNPNSTIVERHLQRCYPKITGPNKTAFYGNTMAQRIDQAEALVFWLRATASSPSNPFQASRTFYDNPAPGDLTRSGYYEFDERRLIDQDGDGFYTFRPRNCRDTDYIYFESRTYPLHLSSSGAALGVAQPYYQDDPPTGSPPPRPVNPNKFQIICAGFDGDFGQVASSVSNAKRFPSGLNYNAADRDNLTNFSDGRTLGDARPQ